MIVRLIGWVFVITLLLIQPGCFAGKFFHVSYGTLLIQGQWPQAASLHRQALPEGTVSLQVSITGEGLDQPLTRTVTRNLTAPEETFTILFESILQGSKQVTASAFNSNGQLIGKSTVAVTVKPGETADAVLEFGTTSTTTTVITTPAPSPGFTQLSFSGSITGRSADEPGAAAWSPDDNKMYVWAYHTTSGSLADLWAYSVAANSWQRLSNGAIPGRQTPIAYDTVNRKIYLFGGGQGNANDLWEYTPSNDTWTPLSPANLPPGRSSHSLIWDPVNRRLYVFGGMLSGQGSSTRNDLWSFNPTANAWTQITANPSPPPHNSHTAVWDSTSNRMIIYGGTTDIGGIQYLNDAWAYTPSGPDTGTWSPFTVTGITARNKASGVWDPVNQRMYICGGQIAGVATNECWSFTPSTGTWVQISVPAGLPLRFTPYLAWDTLGNRMLLYGGHNGNPNTPANLLNDLWSFVPPAVIGASPSPTPTPTPAPTPTPTSTPTPAPCTASVYVVTTLASSGGFVANPATPASFNQPQGVAVDSGGNVYVGGNWDHRISKIDPGGVVTTLAGSGTAGSTDGTTTAAQFQNPLGVAVDSTGNVYVAGNISNRIRRVTSAGVVTTLADSGGFIANPGTPASFARPYGVAVDSSGNLYVADTDNNRIRKVTPAGVVTTLAGSGTSGTADGIGIAAQFNQPNGVAVDNNGNLYVAENNTSRIRRVTSAGEVTTLASSGGFVANPATPASFSEPYRTAVDSSGNVYFAEYGGHRIRKIDPSGVVTTLAGSGTAGSTDGTGTAAQFNQPLGVAVDSACNVFVAEQNNRIRKLTPQ